MSYDGDIPDMNGCGNNPGEASDIPKHGFGLADDSAGVETANVVTQPSPVMAAAAGGESVDAPVALAAALAFNQAALDGRPLDVMDGSGGDPAGNGSASATPLGMVASPRAQPMVRLCMLDYCVDLSDSCKL